MLCALCEKQKPLQESHIIPEFVYAPCYNEKHQIIGIHGRGKLGREVIQKGLREPLLCVDCEQFLNDNYEKPFKSYWFDRKPLPSVILPDADPIHLADIDYVPFKLFHLSVLFRCGVSKLPTFSEVQLGPHENKLRDLILNRNPGRPDQYPLLSFAAVDKNNAPVWRIITRPRRTTYKNRTFYGMLFGGCMWYYSVSSCSPPNLVKMALKASGSLYLIAQRWETFPAIQEVHAALK